MGVHYKLNLTDFVVRQEEIGGLVFDRRVGMFFNVNPVGFDIINLMAAGLSRCAILSRLGRFYETAPASNDLAAEFAEFETLLLEGGLVALDEEKGVPDTCLLDSPMRGIREEELQFIRRNIPRTAARLLDVGCGEAIYARCLSPCHDVVGVDLSFEALRRASVKHGLVADARRLPLLSARFDGALITGHVLGYLPFEMAQRALAEVVRTVRAGGVLIVSMWTDTAVGRVQDGLITVRDGGADGEERALHFFAEEEWVAIGRQYQLEDVLCLSRQGDFGTEYIVSCYRV